MQSFRLPIVRIENEEDFFLPNESQLFNIYGMDGKVKAITMSSSAINIAHHEHASKEYIAAFEDMISILFARKPNYTAEWWAMFIGPLVSHQSHLLVFH